MKRIKDKEITALKAIIRKQRDQIEDLKQKNRQLEKDLQEARSREGKGCLETLIDGIADALSKINFSQLIDSQRILDFPDDYLEPDDDEDE